jgi:hypothetical protein
LPYPPLIVLSRLAQQNYVPLVPGQILEVIPEQGIGGFEDYQKEVNRVLRFHSQEPIGYKGKWHCYRFECVGLPSQMEYLYLPAEHAGSALLLPPIDCGTAGNNPTIFIPYPQSSVKVVADNLQSVRIRFLKDIPRVEYNNRSLDIPDVNTELKEIHVRFLKRIAILNIFFVKDVCNITSVLSYGVT